VIALKNKQHSARTAEIKPQRIMQKLRNQ